MAIRRPRMLRRASGPRPSRSSPAKRIAPPVARAVTEEVEAHDGQGERGPWTEQRPGREEDMLARLADHQSPVGRGRLDPKAEEGQAGAGEDREADANRRLDHDGGKEVG